MYLIETLFEAICHLLSWIWQFVIAFWDLLGIGDFLQSKAIFWLILFVLSLCGTYISAKNKKTLWTLISSLSDIALLFGAIISYVKSM